MKNYKIDWCEWKYLFLQCYQNSVKCKYFSFQKAFWVSKKSFKIEGKQPSVVWKNVENVCWIPCEGKIQINVWLSIIWKKFQICFMAKCYQRWNIMYNLITHKNIFLPGSNVFILSVHDLPQNVWVALMKALRKAQIIYFLFRFHLRTEI